MSSLDPDAVTDRVDSVAEATQEPDAAATTPPAEITSPSAEPDADAAPPGASDSEDGGRSSPAPSAVATAYTRVNAVLLAVTFGIAGLLAVVGWIVGQSHIRAGRILARLDTIDEQLAQRSAEPAEAPRLSHPLTANELRGVYRSGLSNDDGSYLVPTGYRDDQLGPHLRPYPYPFAAAFAIANDCDSTTVELAGAYHRFLRRRYGIPVGESGWLIPSRHDSLSFARTAAPDRVDGRVLQLALRGWVDTLHAFSEQPPSLIPIFPPDLVLERGQASTVALRDSRTVQGPRAPVPSGVWVSQLHLELERPIERGLLLLTDEDGQEHFVAIGCSLGNRPGWQLEAGADLRIPLGRELHAQGLKGLSEVGRLRRLALVEGPESIRIRSASLLTTDRQEVLLRLRRLREEFNLSPELITDHSVSSFLAAGRGLVVEPTLLSDQPGGDVYVVDELLGEGGASWINPAGYTSEVLRAGEQIKIWELIADTQLRDGSLAYLARRCMEESTAPAKPSWANALAEVVRRFVARVKEGSGETYVAYLHLGVEDTQLETPWKTEALNAALADLKRLVYDSAGEIPLEQRVWAAMPSTLYRYSELLRHAPEHVAVTGNDVLLTSWTDPVTQRRFTNSRALHGLTVYVADSAGARVFLDGKPFTSFRRNPPDSTGRPSVTVLDTTAPLPLFDEVDFVYRRQDPTNERNSWEQPLVHQQGVDYYLRRTQSPSGQLHGELVLRADGEGVFSAELPHLDARDTYAFEVSLRPSAPNLSPAVAFQTEDGAWHSVGGADDRGWDLPHLPVGEWTRVVLDYHTKRPGSGPAHQRVVRLKISFEGTSGDRLEFDRVAFLRKNVADRDLSTKVLGGFVDPPTAGVPVAATWGDGPAREEVRTLSDELGWFAFTGVPRGATVEITAQHQGSTRIPDQGRWHDLGCSTGDLRIALQPPPGSLDPAKRAWTGKTEPHAYGLAYVPHSEVVCSGLEGGKPCFQVTHQMSNLGFFDRDRRVENPDGARRVLLMGNCMFEGQQVSAGERLNLQLEQILNERTGQPFEVPNCAFAFLPTASHYWYFLDLFAEMKPEVVVMSFSQGLELMNNCWELEQRRMGYADEHPAGGIFRMTDGELVPVRPAKDYQVFMEEPERQEGDDGYNIQFGINWLKILCRKDRQYPPEVQQAIERYVRILRAFDQACAERGAKLVFALTTEIELMNFPDVWDEEGVDYGVRYYDDNVQAIFDEAGVPLIVLSHSFRKRPQPTQAHWPDDTHWSRAGHRWAAEDIADALLRRGLIERRTE